MLKPEASWAEKYRPKTIDDLILPNENWKKVIQKWIDDRFNAPPIWCDEDDDCSTIIMIHSTEMV